MGKGVSEPALGGVGFVVSPGTCKVRIRWLNVLLLGLKSPEPTLKSISLHGLKTACYCLWYFSRGM